MRPSKIPNREPSQVKDRATGAEIEIADGVATARAPAGSVLSVWAGAAYEVTPVRRGVATAPLPAPDHRDRGAGQRGAAIFSWRGDYRATGWLQAYSRVQDQATEAERAGVAVAGNEGPGRSR